MRWCLGESRRIGHRKTRMPSRYPSGLPGSPGRRLGHYSARHRRFRTDGGQKSLRFRRRALHLFPKGSVEEPGEGRMGDVGSFIGGPHAGGFQPTPDGERSRA